MSEFPAIRQQTRPTSGEARHDPRAFEVCVAIPAYNAARTIGRAVRSALGQRHVSTVVVVDDASSDATAAAAKAADDGTGRLQVIRFLANRGPAAARNTVIDTTTGTHVALLDADDYYLPGRIERLLAMQDGDWDFAADNLAIVPECIADAPLPPLPSVSSSPPIELDLAGFILGNIAARTGHRRELGFLKPVMRRAFLTAHGLRHDDTMRLGEDYALYVRALAAGARFLVSPAAGYVAVVRDGSLSDRHNASDLARIAAFDAWVAGSCNGLGKSERSALAAHRRATIRKAVHGEVIDLRRHQGYRAAVLRLLRSPGAIPHVVLERLRAALVPRPALSAPPVMQLLFDPTPPDGPGAAGAMPVRQFARGRPAKQLGALP